MKAKATFPWMLPIMSIVCLLLACNLPAAAIRSAIPTGTSIITPVQSSHLGYQITRESDPDRSMVYDSSGNWLATFTDHAYTVTLEGPERMFSDENGKRSVTSTIWVRTLPALFDGQVNDAWLASALQDTRLDVLAIAMQYVKGAPATTDTQGLQIGGEAKYGPIAADDTREEGGDFNDYLGLPWKFGSKEHSPKTDFFRSLDCSGFMRMVWGYRTGLPLTYAPDGGKSIPRHSWEILATAPGVVLIHDQEAQITDFSKLSPGDLVFFHAKQEDHTPQIDHVGMYLGKDNFGHARFISSRQTMNGPTLGDTSGASVLDGSGLYARSFRAARRF
jgi:cell wall-associated NlpC family hydrolase